MITEQLNNFLENISRPEGSITTISKILCRLEPQLVSSWLSGVSVKDGKITGTYYAEIKEKLSDEEFDSLYEALGYDLGTRDIWRDWWCYGALGCTSKTGYTCNTSTCNH